MSRRLEGSALVAALASTLLPSQLLHAVEVTGNAGASRGTAAAPVAAEALGVEAADVWLHGSLGWQGFSRRDLPNANGQLGSLVGVDGGEMLAELLGIDVEDACQIDTVCTGAFAERNIVAPYLTQVYGPREALRRLTGTRDPGDVWVHFDPSEWKRLRGTHLSVSSGAIHTTAMSDASEAFGIRNVDAIVVGRAAVRKFITPHLVQLSLG